MPTSGIQIEATFGVSGELKRFPTPPKQKGRG